MIQQGNSPHTWMKERKQKKKMEPSTVFKAAVEMLSSFSSITSSCDSFTDVMCKHGVKIIAACRNIKRWDEKTSSPPFNQTSMNSSFSLNWAHFDKRSSEWTTILVLKPEITDTKRGTRPRPSLGEENISVPNYIGTINFASDINSYVLVRIFMC